MTFDNHDGRIQFYDLLLHRDNLNEIPEYKLPEDYRFVFYKPGDKDAWIEIEKSSKEFDTWEQGVAAWNKYYEGKDDELINRMVFVETLDGQKVATASAFYDVEGKDQSGSGWLHWVAVRREHQGKGLSKPLISYVLSHLKKLGYQEVSIHTQTTTWLACRIYLDFGFYPMQDNAIKNHMGWSIVKTLTNHPSLSDFEQVSVNSILK